MKKSKNPELKHISQVEGMERFCARWHYKLAIVKLAKKKGLPGFDTKGRVDPEILIPALNEMISTGSELPDGMASPQDWLATEKAKREAIKRRLDENSVMPTADAVRRAGEAGGMFMSSLERMARELPPVLAGLPSSGVAARLESEIENVRRHLKIKLQEIGK